MKITILNPTYWWEEWVCFILVNLLNVWFNGGNGSHFFIYGFIQSVVPCSIWNTPLYIGKTITVKDRLLKYLTVKMKIVLTLQRLGESQCSTLDSSSVWGLDLDLLCLLIQKDWVFWKIGVSSYSSMFPSPLKWRFRVPNFFPPSWPLMVLATIPSNLLGLDCPHGG